MAKGNFVNDDKTFKYIWHVPSFRHEQYDTQGQRQKHPQKNDRWGSSGIYYKKFLLIQFLETITFPSIYKSETITSRSIYKSKTITFSSIYKLKIQAIVNYLLIS